jgi:predicted rRNA methylase YqxC with S4 and FtsJ domains
VLEYANKPKVAEKIERERAENERKAHHHKKQRDFVCVCVAFYFFSRLLPPLDTKPNGCCEIILLFTET